jgi:hypothetical protein
MIYYAVTRDHPYTLGMLLKEGPGAELPVRIVAYEDLLVADHAPRGTWIFSDLDRLGDGKRRAAARVHRALRAAGCRVLNDPARVKLRYELLRVLHRAGLNDFDAYRVTDHTVPLRWPVFIRPEHGHRDRISELIEDEAALAAELERMAEAGDSRDDKIIIEFMAEPAADGQYQKYAAFRLGDRIVSRHIFRHDHWNVKGPKFTPPEQLAREREFIETNPHAERVMRAFELADIEYGRIDYGFVGDRMQVFEINTNANTVSWFPKNDDPRKANQVLFRDRFVPALLALDTAGEGEVALPEPKYETYDSEEIRPKPYVPPKPEKKRRLFGLLRARSG